MEKIKVCNVICDVASGGVEAVLFNYFSHMDREQNDLDLITYGVHSEVGAQKLSQIGFHIIKIPPKRYGFLKSLRAMDAAIRAGRYDVVHTHLTEWNCIPMFLAWKNGVRIRISHSHMADFPSGVIQKTLFMIQKALNKVFATEYIACGDAAARYLYGKRLVNSGCVKILNNAIDTNVFRWDAEKRKAIRAQLGILPDVFCVGHIGRFMEQKNHIFMVGIFYEVLKMQPNSVLLLMGTGPLQDAIKEKVNDLDIANNVHFLGVRGDPEMIYQAMDVFCLPSLFEGLPVVVVEAQAMGLPCLVSDKVSEKAKLTSMLEFMSLEESAERWAEELISMRLRHSEDQIPDGYRIDKAAMQWASIYKA